MKNYKNIFLLILMFLLVFAFIPNSSNAKTTEVYDEETLRQAVENAEDGDTITLTANISITSYIGIIGKNITINGNNFTISRIPENWYSNEGNGSLITSGSGAKLNLVNITLTKASTYGVQAYNGGYVLLDGVTIFDCNYGGVFINGGTAEIKNLILKKNGSQGFNNGIEIGKDSSTTGKNTPTLIMNGTLSSTETSGVIYVDIYDPSAGLNVVNSENTVNKIFINENTLVITDQNKKILYKSNEIAHIKPTGDTFIQTETSKPTTESQEKDDTPKTGIETAVPIIIFIIFLSVMFVVIFKEKFFQDK